MLKVLLIDDEREILNGMKHIVDWESYGYTIAGCYDSTREAMKFARKEVPDLILTDIRMPGITGLDLIASLSEELVTTKFVILSGYDDFNYARKAIEYGASYYLLKPVDEDELVSILKKLKEEINKSKLEITANKKMIKMVEATEMLIEQNAFRKLIKERIEALSDAECNRLHSFTVNGGFYIVLIKMDKYLINNCDYVYLNNSNSFLHLKNVFYNYFKHYIFIDEGQLEVLFIKDDSVSVDLLIRLKDDINKYAGNTSSIGVARFTGNIDDFPSDFSSFCRIFEEKRFFSGKNSVYIITDHFSRQSASYKMPSLAKSFKEGVRKGLLSADSNKIRDTVDGVCTILKNEYEISDTNQIYAMFVEVLFSVKEMLFNSFKMIDKDVEKLVRTELVNEIEVLDDLKEFAINTLEDVITAIMDGEKNGSPNIINQIKYHISTNYSDNISLETIAQKYHFNHCYLSYLFKKETGINFSNYIIDVRLEAAKRFLIETDMSVSEIAAKVGYSNEKSFFHLFKRKIKVSPNRYRIENR